MCAHLRYVSLRPAVRRCDRDEGGKGKSIDRDVKPEINETVDGNAQNSRQRPEARRAPKRVAGA